MYPKYLYLFSCAVSISGPSTKSHSDFEAAQLLLQLQLGLQMFCSRVPLGLILQQIMHAYNL